MIERLKAKIGTNKHVKEVIKGSAFTFLAKIAGTALGLISSLIIARYYGADIIGMIAILNSVLAIFTVFGLMGTDLAILRLIPEFVEKHSLSSAYSVYIKILLVVVTLSGISGMILYFANSFITNVVFHSDNLSLIFLLASPFVFIKAVLSLNTATLRSLHKMKLYALMQLLPSLINVVLLVFLTYFFYDKSNPIYIIFATSLIIFLISFFLIYKNFNKKKINLSVVSFSKIINLSFPMFIAVSISLIMTQIDTIMLGILRTKSEVGIYAIVMKLALLTSFILTAVNSASTQKFSQLYYSGDIDNLALIAQKSVKIIFIGTLPLIILYIVAGEFILGIFGKEYIVGYGALVFISVGQLVNASTGSVGMILNMTGHQNTVLKVMLLGALLNILLNYILIPLHGITGAAIASMISISIVNILSAVAVKHNLRFNAFYIPFYQNKEG